MATTLLVLGIGLYLAVSAQVDRQLMRTLRKRVALTASDIAPLHYGDLTQQQLGDRNTFIVSPTGVALSPADAPRWARVAATQATSPLEFAGEVNPGGEATEESGLRVVARRMRIDDSTVIIIAGAESSELEDQYAGLIIAFSGAALGALLLIAIGGSFLVRKSTAPIEASFNQMRDFMSDAAHELRTPVTVIRTGAEVAMQQPREAARYVDALAAIAAESERLGVILDHLLLLARADAHQRPMVLQLFFADDLLVDVANTLRPVAAVAGVSLELAQFEEGEVRGDPLLVRQLLMILLDNAIKYTPRGGSVRLRASVEGGGAVIRVSDTGIGMASDELTRVFERFYRVDRGRSVDGATVTAIGGAGLGLTIAKWIIDEHRADISISSTPGEGTEVVVRFEAVS